MVLFRCLAHAVLVPVLLAGCSQSLFDDGSGGSGGNGRSDGGPVPNEPDARPDQPDGGTMPDEPDAGSDMPDAGLRDLCPAPCAGDAFGDFRTMQGGPTDRWGYVEVQPEEADSPYVAMTTAILPGPVLGWVGTGAAEPSIGLCNTPRSGPPCLEMAKLLALTTQNNAADTHHPGLMWIAQSGGRYALTGNWRVSSVAPAVETSMTFTLNSHSNVIHQQSPILTAEPHEFDIQVDVVAGDRIVLTATSTTDESVAVGVDYFVTGPLTP